MIYVFLILRLKLLSTAEGPSLQWPNDQLRLNVKIVPTVQHCKPCNYEDHTTFLSGITQQLNQPIPVCGSVYLAYNRVVMVWWFRCKFIMILTPIWTAFAYISIQQLTFLAGLKNLTTLNAGTAYQINKSSGITFSCLLLTIYSENLTKLLLKLHHLQLWTCKQVVHFSTNKYEMHTA